MQNLNQQLHNQQYSTIIFFNLRCASYMFRPLHGHRQGVLQETYTIMTDSVTNVNFFLEGEK